MFCNRKERGKRRKKEEEKREEIGLKRINQIKINQIKRINQINVGEIIKQIPWQTLISFKGIRK